MLVKGGGGVGGWYTRYERYPRETRNSFNDDELVLLAKPKTKKKSSKRSPKSLIVKVHPSGRPGFLFSNMAVEEESGLNIDGTKANARKYKPSIDRVGSNLSDLEDGNVAGADRVSVHSGESGRSKTTSQLEEAAKLPWYRGVTCKDIRDIMPTVLILIGGLLIMIFVIPYAFSSVIKQLEAEQIMEKARSEAAKGAKEAAMLSDNNFNNLTTDDSKR